MKMLLLFIVICCLVCFSTGKIINGLNGLFIFNSFRSRLQSTQVVSVSSIFSVKPWVKKNDQLVSEETSKTNDTFVKKPWSKVDKTEVLGNIVANASVRATTFYRPVPVVAETVAEDPHLLKVLQTQDVFLFKQYANTVDVVVLTDKAYMFLQKMIRDLKTIKEAIHAMSLLPKMKCLNGQINQIIIEFLYKIFGSNEVIQHNDVVYLVRDLSRVPSFSLMTCVKRFDILQKFFHAIAACVSSIKVTPQNFVNLLSGLSMMNVVWSDISTEARQKIINQILIFQHLMPASDSVVLIMSLSKMFLTLNQLNDEVTSAMYVYLIKILRVLRRNKERVEGTIMAVCRGMSKMGFMYDKLPEELKEEFSLTVQECLPELVSLSSLVSVIYCFGSLKYEWIALPTGLTHDLEQRLLSLPVQKVNSAQVNVILIALAEMKVDFNNLQPEFQQYIDSLLVSRLSHLPNSKAIESLGAMNRTWSSLPTEVITYLDAQLESVSMSSYLLWALNSRSSMGLTVADLSPAVRQHVETMIASIAGSLHCETLRDLLNTLGKMRWLWVSLSVEARQAIELGIVSKSAAMSAEQLSDCFLSLNRLKVPGMELDSIKQKVVESWKKPK